MVVVETPKSVAAPSTSKISLSIMAMRCQRAVFGFFGLDDLRSAIGCILSN
jgi:hypothetical protein